jgi:hypothetical protein
MAHFLGPANHSFFSIFFFFLHRLTQAELLLLLVAVIDRLLPSSSIQHHRSPPRVLQIFPDHSNASLYHTSRYFSRLHHCDAAIMDREKSRANAKQPR